MNRLSRRLLFLVFLFGTTIACRAGDPLFRDSSGAGIGWDPGAPVPVYLFGGDLPKVTHDQIETETRGAVDMWRSTPRAALDLRFGGDLSGPLTVDSFPAAIFAHPDDPSDTTPIRQAILIVPDTDGKLLDRFIGTGTSQNVYGLANTFNDGPGGRIRLSVIFLNGIYQDPTHLPITVRHEMGHALGLAHMEANVDCGELVPPADGAGCEEIPLMRRGMLGGFSTTTTLDDQSTLSGLYPSPAPGDATGSIQGQLILRSTGLPVPGAVIVARSLLDPRRMAVSSVTSSSIDRLGRFAIPALPPGDYRIEAVPILSLVGPEDSLGDVSSPYPTLASPSTFYAVAGGTETPLDRFVLHVDGGQHDAVDLTEDDVHPDSPLAPHISEVSAILRSGVVYAEIRIENPNGEPIAIWERRSDGSGMPLNPGTWLWDQGDTVGIVRPLLHLTLPPGGASSLTDTRSLQLYVGGTRLYSSLDDKLPGVPNDVLTDVPLDVEPVVGDVNGDGRLTIEDLVLALRSTIGLTALTLRQQMQADIAPLPGAQGRYYGDGKIDISDAVALLRRLIGIDTGPLIAPGPMAQSVGFAGSAEPLPDRPTTGTLGVLRSTHGALGPHPLGGLAIP